MLKFRSVFPGKKQVLIGMIHVEALPGTPLHKKSIDQIIDKACQESEVYLRNEIDGILVENMHDVPYVQSQHFQPETVACMTRICTEIRKIIPKHIPCGVQVLAGGNKEALAIAKACSFNFIRAEGFVFSHIADEGFTDANAGHILRYRKQIDAEDVLIFTDIKKKHSSHAITSDVSLIETAKAAEYFLSDGLIITGSSTAHPADTIELHDVKRNSSLPIFIGSGVTVDNLREYVESDAFIVGSHFKKEGKWNNNIDEKRIRRFIAKLRNL